MRLSETITIYFAVGASFGVKHFLGERKSGSRLPTLLKAIWAAILWPLAAAKLLYSGQRPGALRADVDLSARAAAQFAGKIEDARRELMASLYKIVELAQVSSSNTSSEAEVTSRDVRQAIEKYVGLTLAAARLDSDALPGEREMEVARIAGRRGEDLLLAGRCIQRRNAARLVAHQARSRTELLHALAEVRDFTGQALRLINPVAARHLSVVTLRFYGHAFNLLALLEDETAARSVSRLLNAECVRLRRLETLSQQESVSKEGESCARQMSQTIFTSPTQPKALNEG